MRDLASEGPVLRKRLKRLLGQDGRKAAAEISGIILPQLQEVGKLALIGGAVRDVARSGVSRFRSDLDFVLYDGDATSFQNLMKRLAAVENRFGGFSIRYERWKVDIWALERTWARTAGLRNVSRIHDLLDCTFFDWDAIVFDLHTKSIIAKPDYFESLNAFVMDVNLEENPNPTGSLVRALRRGALWQVRFGPKLTSFVRRQLDQENWAALVRLDEKAFTLPVLRHYDPSRIRARLSQDVTFGEKLVSEPFGAPRQQLPLFSDLKPITPSGSSEALESLRTSKMARG
jgi:hypothetical protein